MRTAKQILKAINATGKCIKHLTLEKVKSIDGDYWCFVYSRMGEYGSVYADCAVYVPRLVDLPLKHWIDDGKSCIESALEWEESRIEKYGPQL